VGTTHGIPSSVTQYTFVAYGVNFSTLSGTQTLFGGYSSAYLAWRTNTVQYLITYGGAAIGTGTPTLSSGTPYTLALTSDSVAAQAKFYICSGGTCTQDGTGVTTNDPPSTPIYYLGWEEGNNTFLNGSLPELDFYQGIYNSTNLSEVATYSRACYGI
jgi:hypothetical protein